MTAMNFSEVPISRVCLQKMAAGSLLPRIISCLLFENL